MRPVDQTDTAERVPRTGHWVIRVVLLLFGLMWNSGMISFVGSVWPELYGELRKPLEYRAVEAMVTAYTLAGEKAEGRRGKPSEHGTIDYGYEVGGTRFEGTYDQPGPEDRLNEYSENLTGPFEAGRTLRAWYDPADPAVSTLVPVAQPQTLAFALFLMPFLVVGIGMMVVALTGRGLPRDFSPAAVASLASATSKNRLRPPWYAVAMPVYAFGSVVSAFAVFGLSFLLDWTGVSPDSCCAQKASDAVIGKSSARRLSYERRDRLFGCIGTAGRLS